jgi:hypothetical protein
MRSKRQDFELMGKTIVNHSLSNLPKKSKTLAKRRAVEQEAKRRAAEQEAKRQRQRQLQPLFTFEERRDINEKWRNHKAVHKAVEPWFWTRATLGVFELWDPTPKNYKPNAGPHMMSVGTYANDIITLMRHWDVLHWDVLQNERIHPSSMRANNLYLSKTWVIHLVVQRLKNEGYYTKNGDVFDKKKQLVEVYEDKKKGREHNDSVFMLLYAHDLRQNGKIRYGDAGTQPKKLPAERPTAEEIEQYIRNMDTQTIIKMIHNDTWNARSVYLKEWGVFQP